MIVVDYERLEVSMMEVHFSVCKKNVVLAFIIARCHHQMHCQKATFHQGGEKLVFVIGLRGSDSRVFAMCYQLASKV